MSPRVLLLTMAALIVAAAASPLPSPASIATRLDSTSAGSVVDELEAHGQFDAMLDRIGWGFGDWIALAPRLKPGTDGASTEGLAISLARGLRFNPAAVLRVVSPDDAPGLGIKTVCAAPFIEVSRDYIRAYKHRALAALAQVHAPDLQAKRDQCVAIMKAP